MELTEDDIYRSSTQYRLWSYTPEDLSSLRSRTHNAAAKRVVAALAKRPQPAANETVSSDASQPSVATLTLGEEQQILIHYARNLILWSRSKQVFDYPYVVTATAVMYYRRFYLSNSPMTYHPRSIFPTCLMLAVKTEHNNPRLNITHFCNKIRKSSSKFKPSEEEIMAPEYLISQGLRFTFQVRHPGRGLDAGRMELDAIARGQEVVKHPSVTRSASDLRQEVTQLKAPEGAEKHDYSTPERRVKTAFDKAQELLLGAALLTDAYFLFTPAQIWMASLMMVDEPLMLFYLEIKLGSSDDLSTGTTDDAHVSRILSTLRACRDTLKSYEAPEPKNVERRDKMTAIDKKLWQCLNPDKRDLVKLNMANKAGEKGGAHGANGKAPVPSDAETSDSGKKKRKVVDDDVFGPPLKKHESPLKRATKHEAG
ncbi:MAG: hypothetical protein Q9162_006054 [Coniocarpon cinnabarinum]